MKVEGFKILLSKTVFIEHLTERQQVEVQDFCKELLLIQAGEIFKEINNAYGEVILNRGFVNRLNKIKKRVLK